MIKFEKTTVSGFEPAIRGMRNPKNSWGLSDSESLDVPVHYEDTDIFLSYLIGSKDADLAMRLNAGGPVHSKYRRMITVWTDIIAPLYWWKEFDTYKVGTVADSCSTMHKIHAKEFELSDFSTDHLLSMHDICPDGGPSILNADPVIETDEGSYWSPLGVLKMQILMLNKCRKLYLDTKDKKYWWQMIQLLPTSYNQRRTVMLNYEVLSNIYISRNGHKLDEWQEFRDWIEKLPYSKLICGTKGD